MELEDFKNQGKNAFRYDISPQTSGDYFVKDLIPLVEKQTEVIKNREYVEAVPGPAIVISKETYKKMQENENSKQNKEKLKRYKNFFKNIKDETDKDLTL